MGKAKGRPISPELDAWRKAADAVIHQARYAAVWRSDGALDILRERIADYDAATAKLPKKMKSLER